jgi:deoxyribose-phosphate aldolase
MTPLAFAALFDHTLLKPEATVAQVARLCDEAREHRFATVCVNPWQLATAVRRLEGSDVLPITVVGFPLGANLTSVKVFETKMALDVGAREIDMVINVGALKSGDEATVRRDIAAIVEAARTAPVKVIVETALLSSEEIFALTQWCVDAGAAFIKTSTGFAARGASVEDVRTMARAGGGRIKIKASGGIRSLEQALALVEAGADRLGASASVAILEAFRRAHGS